MGVSAFTSLNTVSLMKPFKLKLYQFETKKFSDDSTNINLQIGVIGYITLLSIIFNDDNPSPYRGLMVLTSLLTPTSLISLDFQVKGYQFSLNFFSEYFEGWVAWEADVRGEG